MRRAALLLSAVSLASCGANLTQTAFVRELERHFNNLNADALSRREMLSSQTAAYMKNPAGPPPTGIQYSSFHFDEKGWIAYNVKCGRPDCGQSYLVVDYYGKERLCARCGWTLLKAKPKEGDVAKWLKDDVKAEVKPMFEPASKSSPMKATVRYIRRTWVYDPSGKSDIDVSKIGESKWKAEIKADYLPGASGAKVPAGFHRPDAVFVAEQEFEFDGKALKAVGMPREEAVRPWLELRNLRLETGSAR